MTFEEFGAALDDFVEAWSGWMKQLSERLSNLTTPCPEREARRLAEDAAREGYDYVERNDVHVFHGDEAILCLYKDDSGELNHVTTYDLDALTEEIA